MTHLTIRRLTLGLTSLLLVACTSTRSDRGQSHPGSSTAHKEASMPSHKLLLDYRGVAANGFDVVAYHTENLARKGSSRFAANYGGASWQFATASHRSQFLANPERYVPAYGGYCAFGVASQGVLAPTNPEAFRIQDGRLLLFFDGEHEGQHVDTTKMWDPDAKNMRRAADQKWPTAKPMPQP